MPNSRICCVDASIIIRLLIDRADHPVQTLWKSWQEERVTIIAPTLLLYEVTNALYQQQRQNLLSLKAVSLMIETARVLPVRLHMDSNLYLMAHHLATELGLPAVYDSHYLATAAYHNAGFWTADKKLVAWIGDKLDWVHYVPR